MKLGEKILNYRKKLGLSQEELGDKVGVSRQTVSKWEIGQTVPELEKMILLAKEFETTIDELVKDESESEENDKQVKSEKQKNNTSNIKLVNCILIIAITCIGIFLGIILYRFLMVKTFSDKFLEIGMEKNADGYNVKIYNYKISEIVWNEEYGTVTTSKDEYIYNLGNKYKKLYGGWIKPVRIEYLDEDTNEYYDIDCVNKTYKKLEVSQLDIEARRELTGKDLMIQDEIVKSLNLFTKKGVFEITTDFDYNIDLINGNEYSINNRQYYEDNISATISKWGMSFGKREYEDKVHSIETRYNIDYGVVNENLVRLPDLTGYTQIEY